MNFFKVSIFIASLGVVLLQANSINEAIEDAIKDNQAERLQAILEAHPPDTLIIDHHLSAALFAAITRDNAEAVGSLGDVLAAAGVMTKDQIMQTAAYSGAPMVLNRILDGASPEAVEDLLCSLQGQSAQDEPRRPEILSLLQARALANHAKPGHGNQAELVSRQVD